MANDPSRFVVVLGEGPAGQAQLRFDVKATSRSDQDQQKTLIDATIVGKMVVLADLETVVHGTLTPDGTPATLLVLKFSFHPGRKGKRFKSAEIKMTFHRGHGSAKSPNVHKIAPDGAWGVEPIEVGFGVDHGPKVNLDSGQGPSIGYEGHFTKNYGKKTYARVEGARRSFGRDRSADKNSATWNLYENDVTKDGIPTLLKTAVLIEREKAFGDPVGERFWATLEIQGEPALSERMEEHKDKLKEKVQRFIGGAFGKPKMDEEDSEEEEEEEDLEVVRGQDEKREGVFFNPGNPTAQRGYAEHMNELEKEDLESLKQIIMIHTKSSP
ncbi:hypothetical protein Hte_007851 [Hypoxylon texense]